MLIPYKECSEIIRAIFGIEPRKVLHIGAHIGEEASDYVKNNVEYILWFEANNLLTTKLEENLAGQKAHHKICPIALWDTNTELDFHITNNIQSSSLLRLKEHSKFYPNIIVNETKRIKVYRLDTIFQIYRDLEMFSDFNFINIDTQGAELMILRGMGSYLTQGSVKAIYLEVNKEELYENIPLVDEIDNFLTDFKFYRLKTRWTESGWGDALYIRSQVLGEKSF